MPTGSKVGLRHKIIGIESTFQRNEQGQPSEIIFIAYDYQMTLHMFGKKRPNAAAIAARGKKDGHRQSILGNPPLNQSNVIETFY